MSEIIKLVITDDEQLIRSGLKMMLETYADIEVVGLAENGQKAYELCCEYDVDVVLMDIRMPETNGIEGTWLIKQRFSKIAVLILTTFQDTEYILEAMQNGASGYLLKDSDYDDIYQAIKSVYVNQIVIDATISKQVLMQSKVVQKQLPSCLTEKDKDILRLIAQGLNNKEIAQQLYLAEGTIKNSVSQLLVKLALRDRTQLAIFALEHGLK